MFDFFRKKPTVDLVSPPLPLPQRNDLCWCGSGHKYKKCHLGKDQQTLQQIEEQEEVKRARRSRFS